MNEFERRCAEAHRKIEEAHAMLQMRLRCYMDFNQRMKEMLQKMDRDERISRYDDTYTLVA